jgi:hypothetical protein
MGTGDAEADTGAVEAAGGSCVPAQAISSRGANSAGMRRFIVASGSNAWRRR